MDQTAQRDHRGGVVRRSRAEKDIGHQPILRPPGPRVNANADRKRSGRDRDDRKRSGHAKHPEDDHAAPSDRQAITPPQATPEDDHAAASHTEDDHAAASDRKTIDPRATSDPARDRE
ncbi:hypothetical protein Apa02nite_067910 [Actinoplanes palleronii]|uniref:Uncharacterized protein n=1 Tax=Actinoplanes palleronii TaxID=113570 RepID=A0ABQ4BJ35_9ACTN|nr:hypothetical protein Apa02nite_067910 [Actinoplanes palleronii]